MRLGVTLDEEDEDADVAVEAEGMRFIAETNLTSAMGGMFSVNFDEHGLLGVTATNMAAPGSNKSFSRRLR